MNLVTLYGRLARDPDLKYSQGGTASAFMIVAVDRGMSREKRQQAEASGQPTADFISVKAFGKTAELIANHFKKGDRIALEGRISTGSFERNGERIYTTDIVANRVHFIESAKDRGDNGGEFGPKDDKAGYYEVDSNNVPF